MSNPSKDPSAHPETGEEKGWINREELAARLVYWPLVRMLLLDWRFRIALVATVMVFVLAAIGLPRIWKATPPDFNPVIKISLLDKLQARYHGGKARELDARGERPEAARQWRLAVANNPGAPTLLRGSISNILAQPSRHVARYNQALQQTFWLLQLTDTNRVDRDLAVQVCEHFGVSDFLVSLVRQTEATAGPAPKSAALKAMIRLGLKDDYQRFRQAWSADLPNDPNLDLHHAAWQAAWGSGGEREVGLAALKQAAGDPAQREAALQLLLMAQGTLRQIDDYGATLAQLNDLHADTPLQHVGYWMLLLGAGRTNDAVNAARAHSDPPLTPMEVTRQAQALIAMGLTDDATKFLEHFSLQLGAAGNVWSSYARLLIEQESWRELRALAGQIRQNEAARASLGGYSWFLEGLAFHHLGNEVESAAAFAAVPQFPLRDSALVFDTAGRMAALGAWAPVRDLLLANESSLGRYPEFWRLLLHSGWELRDFALVRRSADQQYNLLPGSRSAQNDLAAALLIAGEENERALEITGRLIRLDPTSLPARINHACALIRNGQTTAAKPLLLSVDEAKLDPVALAALNFVRLELAAGLEQAEATLAAAAKLDTNNLMPPQLERMEELRRRAQAGFPPVTAQSTNPR